MRRTALLGNWSEEQELKDARLKDYLHRKKTGQLLVMTVQGNLSTSLQEVPLTYSEDGLVRFGDSVMLYSVQTEGVLSVDIADDTRNAERGFPMTTSTLTQAHVARNVFVIEPFGSARSPAPALGSVLRYGQTFRLALHPSLRNGKNIYLHSQPVSALSASKVSRFQEVCMVASNSHDTLWIASFKDPAERFEQEGQPVPANAELLVQHNQTKQALSSEKKLYYNDYGQEYEVCAKTHVGIQKNAGLYAELMGRSTVDTPTRHEGPQNLFAFLTAANVSADNSAPTEGKSTAGGSATGASLPVVSSEPSTSDSAPAAAPAASAGHGNGAGAGARLQRPF